MKKDAETKKLFLEQLKKTPIIQIACEKLSISRASFYRWKNEDQQFAKDIVASIFEGHLMVNDLAESQLIGAVKDRNLSAITYWLRYHHPDYKPKIEINGSMQVINELTDDQKKIIEQALALADVTLNKRVNKPKK